MGVEAVKIKLAQSLENGEDVEVNVMPFTDHPELSEQFKNNFFADVGTNVNLYDSFQDFMKKTITTETTKDWSTVESLKCIGYAKNGGYLLLVKQA